MEREPIRFYLDESLSSRIVRQLRRQDIDIIRGPSGVDDPVHLARAIEMGQVVRAVDDDFLKLSAQGIELAGIIWREQDKYSIGDWIRYLRFIHAVCDADELRNAVYFVFHVD